MKSEVLLVSEVDAEGAGLACSVTFMQMFTLESEDSSVSFFLFLRLRSEPLIPCFACTHDAQHGALYFLAVEGFV